MAARWQDTVHGHMETARQCAALTAITMQENSTATWEWMIMIAGLVTSALQKNAQQEHTEDKIVVLRETKFYISTNFQDTLFYQNTFLKPSFTSKQNLLKSGFSFHHFYFSTCFVQILNFCIHFVMQLFYSNKLGIT